jgi:hypothetical protein
MKIIKWEKWKDIFNQDSDSNGRIVLPTPAGMISHKIDARASGGLNFIVGNTNFDLDNLHLGIIKNVQGVEIITPLTPYKFRICIGKAFDTKAVLREIEKSVGCYKIVDKVKLTDEQKILIKNTKKTISKNKFWAIYILPNGKFESYTTNDSDLFFHKYQFFKGLEDTVGGILLSPTKDKMVY